MTHHITIANARSLANRLDAAVTVYAILGVAGSVLVVVVDPELVGLGFVGLLSTVLTAGCAWALVHGLRLLAVIAERDLPAPPSPVLRPAGSFYERMESTSFLVAVTVGVLVVVGVIVVAALTLA